MKLRALAPLFALAALALTSCRVDSYRTYPDRNPSSSGYYGYSLKRNIAFARYEHPKSYGPTYREHYRTHYGVHGKYDPMRYYDRYGLVQNGGYLYSPHHSGWGAPGCASYAAGCHGHRGNGCAPRPVRCGY